MLAERSHGLFDLRHKGRIDVLAAGCGGGPRRERTALNPVLAAV
jgi:hypothetical protein